MDSDPIAHGRGKRLRRVRELLAYYNQLAEESGNPELTAFVHDLDSALAVPRGCPAPSRNRS